MTEVLMDWPSPDQQERRRRRTLVLGWLVLAVLTLIAATALVHGFDVIARRASMAALIREGDPIYSTGCAACGSGFRLPLPDGRSFAVWALAMAAAALTGGFLRRFR